jgi:hypothetical protein
MHRNTFVHDVRLRDLGKVLACAPRYDPVVELLLHSRKFALQSLVFTDSVVFLVPIDSVQAPNTPHPLTTQIAQP